VPTREQSLHQPCVNDSRALIGVRAFDDVRRAIDGRWRDIVDRPVNITCAGVGRRVRGGAGYRGHPFPGRASRMLVNGHTAPSQLSLAMARCN
jgi:hypothetical protein